jgi:hypothetical protein
MSIPVKYIWISALSKAINYIFRKKNQNYTIEKPLDSRFICYTKTIINSKRPISIESCHFRSILKTYNNSSTEKDCFQFFNIKFVTSGIRIVNQFLISLCFDIKSL